MASVATEDLKSVQDVKERPSITARRQGLKPGQARIARALELALILAALATIPLVLAHEQGVDNSLIELGDWLVWAVFVAEYVGMLWLALDRRSYLRSNWLRVAVILVSYPPVLELVALTGHDELARLLVIVRLVLVA